VYPPFAERAWLRRLTPPLGSACWLVGRTPGIGLPSQMVLITPGVPGSTPQQEPCFACQSFRRQRIRKEHHPGRIGLAPPGVPNAMPQADEAIAQPPGNRRGGLQSDGLHRVSTGRYATFSSRGTDAKAARPQCRTTTTRWAAPRDSQPAAGQKEWHPGRAQLMAEPLHGSHRANRVRGSRSAHSRRDPRETPCRGPLCVV
jgi:hypothetical protein